jgi:aminoglycoside phosphotransferase (APT) family kinase protein
MSTDSVTAQTLRRALTKVDCLSGEVTATDISSADDGVNEVYTFSTGLNDPARAACKFATFSTPASFQAGVTTAQFVAAHTEVPVPKIYAFESEPDDMPVFQIMEFVPGDPLQGHPDPDSPGPARALGRVIRELGAIPVEKTDSYGWIQRRVTTETDDKHSDRAVTGEYDTCSEWLLQYGLGLYDDPPSHDTLAAVSQTVPAFLREHRDRFPDSPRQSIVLTDFGPGNLLAAEGTVSESGRLDEVAALIDLERAKIGPIAFNAINAEFLMQRWIDDPVPVVDALYDPLPFGPDHPRRDLYRLLAMGREVAALDLFYENGGNKHERRGNALAREIESILESG